MLAAGGFDALYFAIPPSLHQGELLQAANTGIHLFAEKPVSLYLDEALEMDRAIREAGIIATVGFQQRHDNWHGEVRDFLADKRLLMITYVVNGTLESHSTKHTHTETVGGPQNRVWTANRAWSGSTVVEGGIHQTDLMRYYLGDTPASWVIGQAHRGGSHLSEGMESEAQSLAYVQFENGVAGIIESGAYGASPGNTIAIVGEKGEIRVGSDSRFRSEDTGGRWEPIPEYEQPNMFDDFIGWIEGGPRHRCASSSGRDTLEILLAIYESSRSRGRVELPLARRGNALEEMLAEGLMA